MKIKMLIIALLAALSASAQQQTANDVKAPAGAKVVEVKKDDANKDARPAKPDGKPAVIVAVAQELYSYTHSYPAFPCDGTGYGPWGLFVLNESPSTNAPAIKLPWTYWQECNGLMTYPGFQYVPLGQYLADRLGDGYVIANVTAGNSAYVYTLIKSK